MRAIGVKMTLDKLLSSALGFALMLGLMDRSLCAQAASIGNTTNVTRMYEDLQEIPLGSETITYLNLGYNQLSILPNNTFAEKYYWNVRKLYLFRNRIIDVEVDAFRGLKHLETLDLSDNNLTTLKYNTFAHNEHLRELVLVNNFIRFERQQTFIRSHSLQTLILSGNRITEVYDTTFVGLTNLRRLMLSDNADLVHLTPLCFRSMPKLRYLSLSNTGVHRLTLDMFVSVPRIIHVHGTPFAHNFKPPLTQLTSESFAELAIFDKLIN